MHTFIVKPNNENSRPSMVKRRRFHQVRRGRFNFTKEMKHHMWEHRNKETNANQFKEPQFFHEKDCSFGKRNHIVLTVRSTYRWAVLELNIQSCPLAEKERHNSTAGLSNWTCQLCIASLELDDPMFEHLVRTASLRKVNKRIGYIICIWSSTAANALLSSWWWIVNGSVVQIDKYLPLLNFPLHKHV